MKECNVNVIFKMARKDGPSQLTDDVAGTFLQLYTVIAKTFFVDGKVGNTFPLKFH